jgi:hypothetical protein
LVQWYGGELLLCALIARMPTDGRTPDTSETAVWGPAERARLFWLLDPGWAEPLLPALRAHFAPDPLVAVLVERRTPNDGRPPLVTSGRIGRRAPVAERDAARALPAELRVDARHLRLVQPLAPLRRTHEDTDILALVAKTVALELEATSELWWRVSPRVLARLALCTGRDPDASAARAMLGRILDEAPGYHPAREPLTDWLDAMVDRFARERAAHTLLSVPDQPTHRASLNVAA